MWRCRSLADANPLGQVEQLYGLVWFFWCILEVNVSTWMGQGDCHSLTYFSCEGMWNTFPQRVHLTSVRRGLSWVLPT